MTTPGETDEGEQLALLSPATPVRRPRRLAGDDPTTEQLPVALVQVDTGLPHLDRPFEYTVPTSMADTAAPGVRVKVRFAGQDLDGFVLERRADAEHLGRLSPLRRVVSPEPVLTPQVLTTARVVADRYAGSLGDVLRLAVPPRHAAAEKALAVAAPEHPALPERVPRAWLPYAAGPAFLSHLTSGGAPTASLLAVPSVAAEGDWRCCSPRPPEPRSRVTAAPCSSCPTTATSCGSRPPWSTCSGRGGTPG